MASILEELKTLGVFTEKPIGVAQSETPAIDPDDTRLVEIRKRLVEISASLKQELVLKELADGEEVQSKAGNQ